MKPKPPKPYSEFPLYAHAGGVWAKKIRGKVHYFGPWSDPQAALKSYLDQRDFLLAGRLPPPPTESVANLLDAFLSEKLAHLATGDITPVTFKEYETTCEVINSYFGKNRPVASLGVEDFNGLRVALAKGKRKGVCQLAAVTLKRRLTIARMIFSEQSKACRKALKAPPLRVLRSERKAAGTKLYEAGDIRKLVKAADLPVRAMILLGINCGFGPQDCFTLPVQSIDLSGHWHNYARPKTEVERRCWLWPETMQAIKAIAEGQRLFDGDWDRWKVAREFDRTCSKAKVRNQHFYTLRRTFETIAASGEVAQTTIDAIMGHARQDMASVYRQKVFDEQLRKCSAYVRSWYLGKITLR